MTKNINATGYTKSNHFEKGSIHWYQVSGSNKDITSLKCRPFIIIGRNNFKSQRVLVSPLQDLSNYVEDGKVKYPYHVSLLKKDYSFLEKDSVILLDQVYTISKEDLYEECYIGKITDLEKLDNAIMYNFDLYESMVKGIQELLSQYEELYKKDFSRK